MRKALDGKLLERGNIINFRPTAESAQALELLGRMAAPVLGGHFGTTKSAVIRLVILFAALHGTHFIEWLNQLEQPVPAEE